MRYARLVALFSFFAIPAWSQDSGAQPRSFDQKRGGTENLGSGMMAVMTVDQRSK